MSKPRALVTVALVLALGALPATPSAAADPVIINAILPLTGS